MEPLVNIYVLYQNLCPLNPEQPYPTPGLWSGTSWSLQEVLDLPQDQKVKVFKHFFLGSIRYHLLLKTNPFHLKSCSCLFMVKQDHK